MSRPDRAAEIFSQGFNCSQAVLAACGTDLGLSREQCLGVACAFGGGMARTGATCGAVTGAMMAIGLRHGKVKVDDAEGKERTYKAVHDFMDRFRSRHKSVECRDLLGPTSPPTKATPRQPARSSSPRSARAW
jgi:C_GCAxxG_C_C family probable redox protein